MPAHLKKRSLSYLLPVAFFLILVARFWHPVFGFTSFLTLDEASTFTRIAAVRETPVYIFKFKGSYDGQFYGQLAHHPLLNSAELAPAMDSYAYRARRILPSMMAWLLAAGNPNLIFNCYCIVNVLAWLALSAVLWDLIEVRGARTWIAWFGVMFSAGAIFSVGRALTDLVALTFVAAALLLATRGRRLGSALSLAAGGLCRETALLAAVDFFRPTEGRNGRTRLRDGIRLCLVAVAPLLLWALYVRYRVGPAHDQWGNFTWPFLGLAVKWRASLEEIGHSNDPLLSLTSLLTHLGLTVQALYFAVTIERGNRWWRLGAVYLLLTAFLSTQVWEGFPGAACRVLLPMTLAFNYLVIQRRAPLTWLLIGNLTVFSGLLFLKMDVPYDDTELATVRTLGNAGIITKGPGWYDNERNSKHLWLWSPRSGQLGIYYWPQSSTKAGFTCSIRSITPTTVTITSDGKLLWSGMTAKDPITVSVEVPLSQGHAVMTFATTGAPKRIPGETRPLNFEVYDPAIVP